MSETTVIKARYPGICHACSQRFSVGELIQVTPYKSAMEGELDCPKHKACLSLRCRQGHDETPATTDERFYRTKERGI